MARSTHQLTARGAATMSAQGLHLDGAGLYLRITKSGTKSWTLIYRFAGKRRELGLGSLTAISLAQARDEAAKANSLLRQGIDPKAARHKVVAQDDHLFGSVATKLIDGIEGGWRNAKHRKQWRATLTKYAASIWSKDVAKIDANDLLAVLEPIWLTKPETANAPIIAIRTLRMC